MIGAGRDSTGRHETLRIKRHTRTYGGFTLLELMIVVVVAAVIAAIAYPSYQEQVRKGRRAAATAALIDAASRQEQFFLDNKSYTTTISAGGLNMSAVTESDTYALSVDAPTGACLLDRCYLVRATPQGVQDGDKCGPLTINSERVKAPNNCW
jgi:type IV pilus assembly protein PilE